MRLVAVLAIIWSIQLSATGFYFSSDRCKERLAELFPAFQKALETRMQHLTKQEHKDEMARRMARYTWIREQEELNDSVTGRLTDLAEMLEKGFEAVLGLAKGDEKTQVAKARQTVRNILERIKTAIVTDPEMEDARTIFEALIGPTEKADLQHLRKVAVVCSETYGLSRFRRFFIEDLIDRASLDRPIAEATREEILKSLEVANARLSQLMSDDVALHTRDSLPEAGFAIAQSVERAEALQHDERLPAFHRAQLATNLRFFRDFSLQPNILFVSYVEDLMGVLKHNR